MENAEVKFLTIGEAWQELCETPDITSPEEYPDHALITMEQLGNFIERANPAPSFQSRVKPWMLACFGEAILADQTERTHRFLEEALELVQACGCSQSEAHQLVDYVYGRSVGDPNQEVGGVMVTLAALCLTNEIDMHAAAETELARVWTKVEAIRAKHAAKPKHSPLPGPSAEDIYDARILQVGPAVPEHPDDLAVNRFATAMKAKLAQKRAEGRGGWEDRKNCSNALLSRLLVEHLQKGDPVDIGNFAMMIHQRGESVGVACGTASALSHLHAVVDAWEAPPGGRRVKNSDVEKWLSADMAPAIDAIRGFLRRTRPDGILPPPLPMAKIGGE